MRVLMMMLAAVVFGGCATSGSRGGSAGAGMDAGMSTAIETGIVAAQRGDSAGYLAMMLDPESAKAICPGRFEGAKAARLADQYKRERATVAKRMEDCLGFAWSRAERRSISGGGARAPHPSCPQVGVYDDIQVHYELDGKHVIISLEGPVRGADTTGWRFAEAPRCRAVGGPAPMEWSDAKPQMLSLATAFADEACACETFACAEPLMGKYLVPMGELGQAHSPSKEEQAPMQIEINRGRQCMERLAQ